MASRQTRRARSKPASPPPRTGAAPPSKRAALAAQVEAKRRAKRTNRIVTITLAAVVALLVGAGALVPLRSDSNAGADPTPAAAAAGDLTVRENSHRLTNPANSTVTLVEFLDFECEACGAAFPAVEQLRQAFGDQVTFVVRYFPIDSHFNANRAARAVEAAAQQDQFEAMYQKMYQTQTQWSEQQVPKDDLFRQYAQELGLDLARWDADYASAATMERIQADIDDGTKLGVNSTPTFFINGQRLEPRSLDDLTEAIEKALGTQ